MTIHRRTLLLALPPLVLFGLGAGLYLWWSFHPAPESPAPSKERTSPESPSTSEVALRGMVVDGDGRPISDAVVTTDGRETTTSQDGTFTFDELDPGTYRLDATADGYVSPGPEAMRRVEVDVPPPSKRNGPVEVGLTLREPARISGRVLAGDEALSKVGITLYYRYADGLNGPLDPFTLERVSTTDASGRFDLQLAPGRLHVIAEPDAHPSKQSRELYLEAGQHEEGLVIDVAPSGAILGRVTDPDGRTLDAEVVARRTGGEARERRAGTDRNGRFRVGGLAAGTYEVVVRARNHRTRVLEEVRLDGDGQVQRNVTLKPAEGLFGRVVGPDGEGVSGALVRMVQPGGRTEWTRTREGGTFEWAEAPEGPWKLRAFSPRYAASPEMTARRGGSATLELGAGGYVEGRVVDGSGTPVSSYSVGVGRFQVEGTRPYGSRAIETKAIRRPDGHFRFGPLRPGTYRLRVKASGYAPTSTERIDVEAGETSGPISVTLGSGGVVEGLVRSKESGQPLAGASVSIHSITSPFKPRRTTTNEQGRYTLKRVPAGRQSLRLAHRGHLTRVISGMRVSEGGNITRNVTMRKKKEGEDFSFQGIGAVLMRSNDGVTIRKLIEGGAAAEAGLKRGDVIEAVDRESVATWSLSKVVETIRGRKGEPVTLRVRRKDGTRTNMTIKRGRVVVDE